MYQPHCSVFNGMLWSVTSYQFPYRSSTCLSRRCTMLILYQKSNGIFFIPQIEFGKYIKFIGIGIVQRILVHCWVQIVELWADSERNRDRKADFVEHDRAYMLPISSIQHILIINKHTLPIRLYAYNTVGLIAFATADECIPSIHLCLSSLSITRAETADQRSHSTMTIFWRHCIWAI